MRVNVCERVLMCVDVCVNAYVRLCVVCVDVYECV